MKDPDRVPEVCVLFVRDMGRDPDLLQKKRTFRDFEDTQTGHRVSCHSLPSSPRLPA